MSEALEQPYGVGHNFLTGLEKLRRQLEKLGISSLIEDSGYDSDLTRARRQAQFVARWTFPPMDGPESRSPNGPRATALSKGLILAILAGHISVPGRLENHYLAYIGTDLNIDDGVFGIQLCTDPIEGEINPAFLQCPFISSIPTVDYGPHQDIFNLGIAYIASRTEQYHSMISAWGARSMGREILKFREGLKLDAKQIRETSKLWVKDLPEDMRVL